MKRRSVQQDTPVCGNLDVHGLDHPRDARYVCPLEERKHFLAPDGQQYARTGRNRRDSCFDILDLDPAILGLGPPGRPFEPNQGQVAAACRYTGMMRDDDGKGMRRIDETGDPFRRHIAGQALRTAETAETRLAPDLRRACS